MKINCTNKAITMKLEYTSIDDTCKKLKKTLEDNHEFGMVVRLENRSEYEFMKVFISIGNFYLYDSVIIEIIEDALLAYELDNYMGLYIPNDEVHDRISYLMSELEKLATCHDMWSDLKHSSIYRMLYDAQWRYENTIEEDGE